VPQDVEEIISEEVDGHQQELVASAAKQCQSNVAVWLLVTSPISLHQRALKLFECVS
jgi:hypothetical protein